jgi:hypothetical protein
MQTQKGAGANARAAIYFNHILEDLGLKSKYDEIRVGSRIRFAYVNKNNKYGINVIGWVDKYPEEFKDIFEIDYSCMFDKVMLSPLKGMISIYNWSSRHPCDEVVFDIFDL